VSGQTISGALAVRDNSPTGLVQQYKDEFALVLPSHVRPEAFVRVAVGVLRRNPKLMEAAQNDPGQFMSVMFDAARLGLEPGTEQYWLIPRKRKGKLVVEGQRGYQGEIELIYRAGATSSVIVELVRDADEYVWNPGQLDMHVPPRWHGPQERPLHIINREVEDRGRLKYVYAYGVMKDKAISKVIELDRKEMAKVKAMAQDAEGQYSPWRNWEESMWLKTGVHRLQKFVPTSSEYIDAKFSGAAVAGPSARVSIAPAVVMPSNDEMWDETPEEVAVGHDHEDDDYHPGCEGCQAESRAADQEAQR